MPNWCYTEYIFEGSKEEIADLYQKLQSLEEAKEPLVKSDFGNSWLGCVVTLFGGDWNEIYCRGTFSDLQLNSETQLSFQTETAWSDMEEVWKFVTSKYSTIRNYYSTEEPGCGYYFTNDAEGKHFPARFQIESDDDETHYMNTLDETIQFVSNKLGKTLTTKEEMDAAVEEYNTLNEDTDDYLYVNEILLAEETN